MKNKPPLIALFMLATVATKSQATIIDPHFAIDPASPSIDGNITPDDVLKTGSVVSTQGLDLGLVDDFFGGIFDNLNALSFGQDPVTPVPGKDLPLFFSVDRLAIGVPGTDVNVEASPGTEEASGDVFVTRFPGAIGTNTQFIDEEGLGLIPGFFGDDLDALELDTKPNPFTYFSIDFLSATNGLGGADIANDILVSDGSGGFGVCASHETMGLAVGDDIDGLILLDRNLNGVCDPMVDLALFSLSTFSPSTFTFSGNPYIPGVQDFLSPADILFTDFTGDFELWAAAPDIGLFPDDEVNALDTIVHVPEPGVLMLVCTGLLGVLTIRRRGV